MRGLYTLILSTNKMTVVAKQDSIVCWTWIYGGIIVIVELLIPTLNKIIRNQGTYFVVIMNNRLKLISVHDALL